jgi:hypothetical protein
MIFNFSVRDRVVKKDQVVDYFQPLDEVRQRLGGGIVEKGREGAGGGCMKGREALV